MLLETCGQYFGKGGVAKRLDRFLAHLQRYVLSKPPPPLDVSIDLEVPTVRHKSVMHTATCYPPCLETPSQCYALGVHGWQEGAPRPARAPALAGCATMHSAPVSGCETSANCSCNSTGNRCNATLSQCIFL